VREPTLSPTRRAAPARCSSRSLGGTDSSIGPVYGEKTGSSRNSRRSVARSREEAQPAADRGAHRHRQIGGQFESRGMGLCQVDVGRGSQRRRWRFARRGRRPSGSERPADGAHWANTEYRPTFDRLVEKYGGSMTAAAPIEQVEGLPPGRDGSRHFRVSERRGGSHLGCCYAYPGEPLESQAPSRRASSSRWLTPSFVNSR
jgi:hypothetical protein